jgi:murein L,D-transpeptidase YcbB/YkuD
VPSPSSGDGSGARLPARSGTSAEARRIAPHLVARLRGQSNDPTDRGLRRMLRRFQHASGLRVDGVYGPATRAALERSGVHAPPPVDANAPPSGR